MPSNGGRTHCVHQIYDVDNYTVLLSAYEVAKLEMLTRQRYQCPDKLSSNVLWSSHTPPQNTHNSIYLWIICCSCTTGKLATNDLPVVETPSGSETIPSPFTNPMAISEDSELEVDGQSTATDAATFKTPFDIGDNKKWVKKHLKKAKSVLILGGQFKIHVANRLGKDREILDGMVWGFEPKIPWFTCAKAVAIGQYWWAGSYTNRWPNAGKISDASVGQMWSCRPRGSTAWGGRSDSRLYGAK